MPSNAGQWNYPALAKPDSDGAFCYHIQRRISIRLSVWLARFISPNAATGIDLFLGLAAVVMVSMNQWIAGVFLIQAFGIFSCVDGEVARIRGQSSKLGDFLDTLTDRIIEGGLIGAIAFSLSNHVEPTIALASGLALFGGVFVLTTSSEKFRSTWQQGYPKRRLERFFCLFCAGSDNRLLILSIGLVASELTGNVSILLWTLWGLAAMSYLNFVVRIGLIYHHFGDDTQS